MLTSMMVASLLVALSPEEADLYASELGRPLPAVVPLEEPVFDTIRYGEGEAPFTIFMNRHGGRYTCGDNDSRANQSTIACGASPAELGEWPGSDAEWTSFMGCAVDLFSRFNLIVTDVEPATGDYVEAVVGGSPWQVGMGSGVGGVAPYQCGVIPRAIVYAFADVYYGSGNWWRDVCETAGQEVVHAFGLDHEYLCEDPMTYLSGCGEKTFQDTDAQCGEFYPRQCDCTGARQNSVAEMLDLFGPAAPAVDDPTPPVVSLTSPAAGAVLAPNGEIEIVANATDDVGLQSVVLEWDHNDSEMSCPGDGEYFRCAVSGTHYTWTLRVGEGPRTFRVRATDQGGNRVTTADRTITLAAGGDDGGDGSDDGSGDGNGDDGTDDGGGGGSDDGTDDGDGEGGNDGSEPTPDDDGQHGDTDDDDGELGPSARAGGTPVGAQGGCSCLAPQSTREPAGVAAALALLGVVVGTGRRRLTPGGQR